MQQLHTLTSLIDLLPERGNRVALRLIGAHENRILTYEALYEEIQAFAHGLASQGLAKGDAVALFTPSSLEWYIACHGILRAGGCVVPVDVQLDDQSLRHILEDSGARVIITTAALAQKLFHDRPVSVKVYLLDVDESDPRSWLALIRIGKQTEASLPLITPEDSAFLFYTSGTTGHPKGVPLTHGKIVYSLNGLMARELVKASDTALLPLPLHHVYPVILGGFYTLLMGLDTVIPDELTGPAIARAILQGNVSAVIGVPRLYTALVAGIKTRALAGGKVRYALFRWLLAVSMFARRRLGLRLGKILLRPVHEQIGPRLRVLASGGSKFDEELGWTLEALGWHAAIGYGLTETATVVSFCSPGDGHLDSVGQPMPGVEIRIDTTVSAGESATVAPTEGVPGEVQVHGPNIFDGYHNLPKKNKEVFTADGWFRTGDLGYLDRGGYLHILGRASTLIVAPGGEKIQPEDVESVYLQDPIVGEIGVLQKDGRLVAIVVPNLEAMTERSLSDAEWSIRRSLAEQSRQLASYKRITDFTLTRQGLPRTRLGKLRRHLLPARYDEAKSGSALEGTPIKVAAMSAADQDILHESAAHAIWDWLCTMHPLKHLTLDTSPQLDLGVDSLEWLNISLEIRHRAGVDLPQEVFGHIETIRDLLKAVNKASNEELPPELFPFDNPWPLLTEQQRKALKPMGGAGPMLWMLQGIGKIISKAFFPLEVIGAENIPSQGQYLMCPNHVSHLDPFSIAASLNYSQLHKLWWGGWQGVIYHNPINRLVSRLAQAVPIDARNAAISSLAVAAAVLKMDRSLVWFPEGRRSPEGVLQPFRTGIGMLLQHFKVPVIPVFISGTFEAMPMDRRWPHAHPIKIVYGTPLMPAELEAMGKGDKPYERMTTGLYEAVKTLGKIHG